MRFNIDLLVSAAVLFVAATSCGGSSKGGAAAPDTAVYSGESVEVERFDHAVAEYGDMDALGRDSVCDRFAPVIDLLGKVAGVADRDSLMELLAASEVSRVFQPDVDSRLPDLAPAGLALGEMRQLMSRQLPEAVFPSRVIGFVTPYSQSVVISDTVLLIGLNHYLGADYAGYAGFDDYRRRLKTPDRMVCDVAEAMIRTQYPFEPGDAPTALSRMLYEGAVAKAVESIVPRTIPSEVMAFNADEMAWLSSNEANIWRRLVDAGMLFSVDPMVAEKLVAPSPRTTIINAEAPGRTGRYVGYRVVDSYMRRHPDAGIGFLLTPAFYRSQSVLVDAAYQP